MKRFQGPPDARYVRIVQRAARVLDVRLAFEAELPLYPYLDRQAVAVPAALALHTKAPHGLVAWDEVLESPREGVVEPRPPVGRRRSLVEHEGSVLGPALDGLVESIHLLPAAQDLLFQPRKIYLRADLVELHTSDLLVQKLPPSGGALLHTVGTGALTGPSRYHPTCPEPHGPVPSLRRGLPERVRCNGLARPVLLTV